jgi:glycosyltransferase involved in cell wall biosynthesis
MEQLPTIQRPTLSLALIAKDEEKNINRLLDSVEGCFDEIILVDTGSKDKTKEIAQSRGCSVYDFEWVESFSKARNFAFSKCTKDYIVWLDLDDVLHNRENFIKWRDHAMAYSDLWFNTYEYAVDKDRNPIISFVRERVFRRSINPEWSYDIHEGIIVKQGWSTNYITTWSVKHLRDDEDIKADRSRNIRIIEKIKQSGKIDARMQFYYGKELYEAGRPIEALLAFDDALKMDGIEHHDKMLSVQYGGYASMAAFDQTKPEFQAERSKYIDKALEFAHAGFRQDPNRAEFYVMAGDAHVRVGNIAAAVPYFAAAKSCLKNFASPYASPIYSFKHMYGEAPSVQLSKIYAHLGLLDKARVEAKECIEAYNSEEAKQVLAEIDRVTSLTTIKNNQVQTDDIVFTCPPQSAYEFDEEIYKTKPLGGSETALVQMARLLKEKTGRRVLVFNMRQNDLVAESGVEYISCARVTEYFSKFKPAVHIAWRHNIKMTEATTYLWCHDLFTPGVESAHNFDKFLALSPFHKNYTMGLHGVPEDKIIVTRNGIDPEKFKFERKPKNPNKIVWMSSPDRGLERAIDIVDEVRKEFPDVELHVYYGIENLHKYGPVMANLATRLKTMMEMRPWVKYHGFTEQSKMHREVSDAVIWNHPNDFIETFCITALETMANGIFPIARRLGALADTLGEAAEKRQAVLLDYDYKDTQESIRLHKNAICRVILNRQWENISFDTEKHSWGSVANEWVEFMGLESKVAEAAG